MSVVFIRSGQVHDLFWKVVAQGCLMRLLGVVEFIQVAPGKFETTSSAYSAVIRATRCLPVNNAVSNFASAVTRLLHTTFFYTLQNDGFTVPQAVDI
jgi:hypothetical protein